MRSAVTSIVHSKKFHIRGESTEYPKWYINMWRESYRSWCVPFKFSSPDLLLQLWHHKVLGIKSLFSAVLNSKCTFIVEFIFVQKFWAALILIRFFRQSPYILALSSTYKKWGQYRLLLQNLIQVTPLIQKSIIPYAPWPGVI